MDRSIPETFPESQEVTPNQRQHHQIHSSRRRNLYKWEERPQNNMHRIKMTTTTTPLVNMNMYYCRPKSFVIDRAITFDEQIFTIKVQTRNITITIMTMIIIITITTVNNIR
jgi:hypothetical protein